jgi:hypothetical protein
MIKYGALFCFFFILCNKEKKKISIRFLNKFILFRRCCLYERERKTSIMMKFCRF